MLTINSANQDISPLTDELSRGVKNIEEYNGEYWELLNVAPHMAAINITNYDLLDMQLTIVYNDTLQHSLPILINIFSNAYYR